MLLENCAYDHQTQIKQKTKKIICNSIRNECHNFKIYRFNYNSVVRMYRMWCVFSLRFAFVNFSRSVYLARNNRCFFLHSKARKKMLCLISELNAIDRRRRRMLFFNRKQTKKTKWRKKNDRTQKTFRMKTTSYRKIYCLLNVSFFSVSFRLGYRFYFIFFIW